MNDQTPRHYRGSLLERAAERYDFDACAAGRSRAPVPRAPQPQP